MTRRGCGVLPAISASTAPGGAHSAFPAHRVDGDLTTTHELFPPAPRLPQLYRRWSSGSRGALRRLVV